MIYERCYVSSPSKNTYGQVCFAFASRSSKMRHLVSASVSQSVVGRRCPEDEVDAVDISTRIGDDLAAASLDLGIACQVHVRLMREHLDPVLDEVPHGGVYDQTQLQSVRKKVFFFFPETAFVA